MIDIWKDHRVQEALKSGRSADDIQVLTCPKCGEWGYYNEGSHFFCIQCDTDFYACSEEETPPERNFVMINEAVSLSDTVTDPSDGYDNQTRPKQ